MNAIEKRARELPVAARLYTRQTGRCAYRRASVTSAEGEPLVRLQDVLSMIADLTPPEGYVLVPVDWVKSCACGCDRYSCAHCGTELGGLSVRPEVP